MKKNINGIFDLIIATKNDSYDFYYALKELAHNIGRMKKILEDKDTTADIYVAVNRFFELYNVHPRPDIPYQKWIENEEEKMRQKEYSEQAAAENILENRIKMKHEEYGRINRVVKEDIICPYCAKENKHPKDSKGHFEIDDDNFIMGCSECTKYFSVNCRRGCTVYFTECLQGDGMHNEISILREEVLRLEEVISRLEKELDTRKQFSQTVTVCEYCHRPGMMGNVCTECGRHIKKESK